MPRQHVENTKEFWSENEAKRANKHANKGIIYWPPFWNKMYSVFYLPVDCLTSWLTILVLRPRPMSLKSSVLHRYQDLFIYEFENRSVYNSYWLRKKHGSSSQQRERQNFTSDGGMYWRWSHPTAAATWKNLEVRKWPKESFRRRLYLTTRKEKYELSIRNTIWQPFYLSVCCKWICLTNSIH